MTEKMTCPNCNGKRFLMAMGGFRKDCEYCNGTGRIEITKGDVREDLKDDTETKAVMSKSVAKRLKVQGAKTQKQKRKKTKGKK